MRGVAALLLLLLLIPSSTAAWNGGTLESVAVRDAALAGTGLVVKVNGMDEAASPDLSLHAERVLVAAHHAREEYNPPAATVSGQPDTNRTERVWLDAVVTPVEARPEVILFVHGSAEVRLEDARMSVSGHSKPSVSETSTNTGERPLATVEVPTLHQVSSSTGILTLTGTFTVSLWDWDIRIQNETAEGAYWSGRRPTPSNLSPVIDGVEEQRLYLDVTNGTLRLPLTGLSVRDLFVAGTTLSAASAVLDLAGGDAPLSLAGPLHFGLGPVEDGSFQGSVLPPEQGLARTPVVQPDPAAPADHAISAAGGEGIWTTGLLVFVLAVAAALLVGWRALRLLHLRRAMSDGDYRSVAAGAGLENSRRFGAEVVVARVVSMVKTGEYAAAADLLGKRGVQLTPAVRAYLWACVHAGTGAVDEARDAVIESLVSDPGMASEVAANGSLRRFLAGVEEGAYS